MDEGGGASRSTDPAAGSSSATDVSLREFLSTSIRYERSNTQLLVGFMGVAGAFAWSQIQRRLEILNHENARVAAIADQTVSADTYASDKNRTDDERDKLDAWRAGVDEKFTKSITRDDLQREVKVDRTTLTDTTTKVLAVIIAAVLVVLTYVAIHHINYVPTLTTTVTTVCTPSASVTCP
jgi:hypothetical protein